MAACAFDHSYDRGQTGVPWGLSDEERELCKPIVAEHLGAIDPGWRERTVYPTDKQRAALVRDLAAALAVRASLKIDLRSAEDVANRVARVDGAAIRVTACCALFDEQDRVLLGRKKDGPLAGYWTIPGGGVLFGEDEREAARREIREETGYRFPLPEDENPLHFVGWFVHRSEELHAVIALFADLFDPKAPSPIAASDLAEVRFFSSVEVRDLARSKVILPLTLAMVGAAANQLGVGDIVG